MKKLNNITIRHAKISDIDSIVNIWFSNFSNTRTLTNDAKRNRTFEYKDVLCNDNHYLLISEINNKVVGFIHFFIEYNKYETKINEENIAWIKTICVIKDSRGQDIGRELINRSIKILRGENIQMVYVKSQQPEYFVKNGFNIFSNILIKII